MIPRQEAESIYFILFFFLYSKITAVSISLLKAVWEHLLIGGLLGSGSYNQEFLFSEHLFTDHVQSTVLAARVTEVI